MNLQFYFEKGKQKTNKTKQKKGKIGGDHRIPLEETSYIYKSNMLPIPSQVSRFSK